MMSRVLRATPVFFLLSLTSACGPSAEEPAEPTVTWYRDVQPVVQQNCMNCHFEGGIGPFALDTYESAAKFASLMADSVRDKRMPPWLPTQTCQPLKNARVLTEQEIVLFETWAREGAPAGEPGQDVVLAPEKPELPWVDMDKAPPEAYLPPAEAIDDYRCFIIDPELEEPEYIVGYDIRPGTPWTVHHVNVVIGNLDQAELLDRRSEGPGWDCIDSIGLMPVAMLGAWAPGTLPLQFPEDTGILLEPGKVIVTQVHYNTLNGNLAPDQTAVRLQFAERPVPKPAIIAILSNGDFAIPPNSTGYADSTTLTIPFNATLWGGGGHMHELGTKFWMTLDQGEQSTCLMDIQRWKYAWQQGYFYDLPQGIQVKAGDTVHVNCAWDNPSDQEIIWGEGVADEMCIGYFYITGLDVDAQWPQTLAAGTAWP